MDLRVFKTQACSSQHRPRAWDVLGAGSQADGVLVTGLGSGALGCSHRMSQGNPCFGGLQSPIKEQVAPILAFIIGKCAHESRPRSDGYRACIPAPKSSLSDPKSFRAGSWALTESTCIPQLQVHRTQMGSHTNVPPRAGLFCLSH